jgi:uncharacterized protein (TIGR02117 family)
MILVKPIKILSTVLLFFFIIITLYISTAFLLSFFPTADKSPLSKEEKIYILYDNVHSDIVFNLNNITEEWIKNLPIVKNKRKGYIAFGWGDKETYLNTPTWDNIKISTSLKALFINTPSLMHITYYHNINYFQGVKAINISQEQNIKIKKSIFKSFNFKEKIYNGYGYNDLFYTSPYKYNFINTCNTWTGEILKNANVPISYWTPFSKNVINSLP